VYENILITNRWFRTCRQRCQARLGSRREAGAKVTFLSVVEPLLPEAIRRPLPAALKIRGRL